MTKKTAQHLANEAKMFWITQSELRRIRRENPADERICEYEEELSIIARLTDWPRLRQRIDQITEPVKFSIYTWSALCFVCSV